MLINVRAWILQVLEMDQLRELLLATTTPYAPYKSLTVLGGNRRLKEDAWGTTLKHRTAPDAGAGACAGAGAGAAGAGAGAGSSRPAPDRTQQCRAAVTPLAVMTNTLSKRDGVLPGAVDTEFKGSKSEGFRRATLHFHYSSTDAARRLSYVSNAAASACLRSRC